VQLIEGLFADFLLADKGYDTQMIVDAHSSGMTVVYRPSVTAKFNVSMINTSIS
jgi:hypothetical protein